MERLVTIAFLLQALRISVPYVLAALGGTISERAGVINLALEGMLLSGAFAATVGSDQAGVAAGAAAGMLGGLAMAVIYGVAVLRFRADQIVAGVAVNLLALGVTRYLLKLIFHSASSSPTVPGLGGSVWADVFVGATAVAAVAAHLVFGRTAYGLRLRAAGEHPAAADSLGVDVMGIRWSAVLASGALAGLGGAWLALSLNGFTDRMSGGRGYIALAAVIFGKWTPLGATAACLLFGLADAVQLNLQTSTTLIPRDFVQMLPYVLTMAALAGAIGRARAPAALGRPWGRR